MANGQEDRSSESAETDSAINTDDGSEDGSCVGKQDSIDRETQLDLSLLRYFESEFSSQVPDQLSVESCYGRGKSLADLTLPRLPKKLLEDGYVGVGTSSDNLDRLVLQSQMNKELKGGCGRGKTLEMQSSKLLGVQEVRPQQNVAAEESPQAASPVKSSRSIFEDNFDCDWIHCSKPVLPNNYNFESLEDFPSLAPQSSASLKSDQTMCNEQVKQKSCQNILKPNDAFEDAEESVIDVIQYNSCTLNRTSYKHETSASAGLSESVSSGEKRDKNDQNDANSMNAEESTLDVTSHNSQALETQEDEACDNVQTMCHNDVIKIHGSLQHDLNPDNADGDSGDSARGVAGHNSPTSNMTHQKAETSNGAGDAVSTCGSNTHSDEDNSVSQKSCSSATVDDAQIASVVASAGVAEDKHNIENVGESAGNLDSTQTSDSASGLQNQVASKPKKKPAGAWKLEGQGVVHVENVPKGRGEEMRMHLAGFGKIIEKEKKSQKGANIWRFRFEDASKCEYAVSCVDGFDLFEGNLPPISCCHLGQTDEDQM